MEKKMEEIQELSDEDPDYNDEDDDCLDEEYEESIIPKSKLKQAQKGAALKMILENIKQQAQQKIAIQRSQDIADYYDIKERIGEGGFGKVYRATEKETGQDRAIKLIYKKDLRQKQQLISEIENLKLLKPHPNIIRMYEHYETPTKVFVVQELLKGEELYTRLQNCETFDEEYAKKLFKQILEAVNFIHLEGVAHRDLKPQNFVFEDPLSDNLKLIDFGLSSVYIPQIFNENSSNKSGNNSNKSMKQLQNMKSIVGTSYFIAPEVYKQKYSQKCDVWSAGVILYVMLCGYPPFFGEDEASIKYAILNHPLSFEDEEGSWDNISNEAKDLISKMLCLEDKRLSALQCLSHPWFSMVSPGSKTSISAKTLDRLRNFQYVNDLKRAILQFIAYHQTNKEEILKQRKLFLSIDQKKNGYVSFEDLKKLLARHLSESEIKKIYTSMDVDQNGKVYWNEFLAATFTQQIYLKEQNLKEAFNFLAKGKGYFLIEELKKVISTPDKQVPDLEFKLIFEEAFPQKKGSADDKIYYSEFKKMMEHLAL